MKKKVLIGIDKRKKTVHERLDSDTKDKKLERKTDMRATID